MKTETLDSINMAAANAVIANLLGHSDLGHDMNGVPPFNGFMNFDFGVSTSNLIEAIHKRFPMVRLEQAQLQNLGHIYSPGVNSVSTI